MDFAQQLLEKVEPSVNIADNISSPTACAGRPTVLSRSEIEHAFFGLDSGSGGTIPRGSILPLA